MRRLFNSVARVFQDGWPVALAFLVLRQVLANDKLEKLFLFSVGSSNRTTRGFRLRWRRNFCQAVNCFFLHASRNPISRYEMFTPQNKYLTIGFEEKSKDFKNKKRQTKINSAAKPNVCTSRRISRFWKTKRKTDKISLRQREESETWCAVLATFSLSRFPKKTAA